MAPPPTRSASSSAAVKKNILQKASSACYDCIASKSPEDWGKLLVCYFIFYSVLTAWMSLHIFAMVDLLPDRDSWCNTQPNNNGFRFCMGEPNYHSWLDKHVTYANAEGVVDGIPLQQPWQTNGGPLENLGTAGNRNWAVQQVRILNQYDLHVMLHPGYGQRVTCKPTFAGDQGKVVFFGFHDPFLNKAVPATGFPDDAAAFGTTNTWDPANGNVFLNTSFAASNTGTYVTFTNQQSFTSGTSTIFQGTDFTVTWTTGAQAPHIVQFFMTLNTNPACAGTPDSAIAISCNRAGLEVGYTGDRCTDCDYDGPDENFNVYFGTAAATANVPC